MQKDAAGFVLASASPSRADVLKNAGLEFDIDPPDLDEAALKTEMSACPAREVACALALAKAQMVSARHPGCLVLGADQVLLLGGDMFDKPANMNEARAHLQRLKGRTHTLIAAMALVKDGKTVWQYDEDVHLQMRDFSDAFLDDYLALAGDKVLYSVGAYQLEGAGALLFERIDGDFFTVLGLPLLALLGFLRSHGHILS